eukprot:scaffold8051_cov114-Isochrysis_galbana.AAC.2
MRQPDRWSDGGECTGAAAGSAPTPVSPPSTPRSAAPPAPREPRPRSGRRAWQTGWSPHRLTARARA